MSPDHRRPFLSWRRGLRRHGADVASGLSIEACRMGERHVIVLAGELDISSRDDLEAELVRAEASDVREIVVDLTDLRFIDSAGMQVFISASARSRASGGRLRIIPGPDSVHRPFILAGLSTRLPFVSR